jgi:putative SOS response-associated peptidase YedK
MPVILNHAEAKLWLSNDVPTDQLLTLLKPAPTGVLQFYPISTAVNKPIADDASILDPIQTD